MKRIFTPQHQAKAIKWEQTLDEDFFPTKSK